MRHVCAISVVLALVCAGACQQHPKETAPPPVSLPSSFSHVFIGTIDNKLKIEMELTRANEELTGQYFYLRTREISGAAEYLTLKGKVDRDGAFTLGEFDTDKQTGAFKGRLLGDTAEGELILRMQGSWSKAGGSVELPFSVSERRIDLGPGLKLKSVQRTEKNEKLKYTFEVTFPKLEGSTRATKFNEVVAALVAEEIPEFVQPPKVTDGGDIFQSDAELGYEVIGGNPSLVSIIFHSSGFEEGAAHAHHSTRVLNYDLKADRVMEFGDLFKTGSDYLKVVSDYCITSLTKQKVPDFESRHDGAGPKIESFKSWNVLPGGLLITFDEYQVASYADGPQEVFIPFAALKEILNPATPAWSLMN